MSTAIIFPPKGAKLKQGLEEPQVVEQVVFMEEIPCRTGSFIYYNNKWYVKQAVTKPSLFKSAFIPAPKPIPESQVPGEYQAWALILV